MKSSVHSLDAQLLAGYLEQHIEGFKGPIEIEKFAGGQSNPTFLITAQNDRYVLRRKPPGELLKSAHAVDREYSVLKALADTEVPVAKAYHLCEDDSVIGSMFYVMSYEQGNIFWDPTLPDIPKAKRKDVFDDIIRVLAEMHSLDVDTIGLANYGKPGSYFERQMSRWSKQYRASETGRIEAMETLMTWLSANMPEDNEKGCLIHGDFRLDNLMLSAEDNKIIAVLDWELSTLGHPISDLAYFCMGLRLPNKGYIKGLANMDRDHFGVPSEEQMVKRYCEIRGIESIENWGFYLAFSFFRLAAIAQGVMKRALDGNASNENALQTGALVVSLAEMALDIIQTETSAA